MLYHAAIPHAAVNEDVYNGLCIPKGICSAIVSNRQVSVDTRVPGAILIPNLWSVGSTFFRNSS